MREGDNEFRRLRLTPGMAPHVEKIFAGEYAIPLRDAPATVLDIGANEGGFTAWARRQWPDARVFAYEPMPSSAELFSANHENDPGVILHQVAVTERPFLCLFPGRNNSGEASAYDLGEQASSGFVQALGVPPAKLPACEFIKIDTEGCEVEILRGLDLSRAKAVVCEYHREQDREEIEEVTAQAGLELHSADQRGRNRGILKFLRPGAGPQPVAKSKRKLFIALPVYSELNTFFTQCLLKLIADPPCELQVRMNPGDSLVNRSRNSLTADFLASDCTDLLFIDTDLIFSTEHVRRILEHEALVVGGMYPKKQEGPLAWVVNTAAEVPPVLPSGLQEVRYIGTGFMRVSRCVFESMIELYGPSIRYTPDHRPERPEYDFWTVGTYQYPDGFRRFLSEDWYFCQRWLDLGEKVWADTRIVLKHVGQAIYPLQSQQHEIFGLQPSAASPATAGAAISPPLPGSQTFEQEQEQGKVTA